MTICYTPSMAKKKPQGYRGVPSKERAERLLERKTQVLLEHSESLSDRQLRFADWWAQPKELRFPPSQKLLTRELEVSEQTLCEWKKNVHVAALWRELSNVYEVEYQVPAVIRVLGKAALGGSINACKFYLDIVGASAPKELTVKHIGIVGVIQEEITNLPEDTLKLLAETVQEISLQDAEAQEAEE